MKKLWQDLKSSLHRTSTMISRALYTLCPIFQDYFFVFNSPFCMFSVQEDQKRVIVVCFDLLKLHN